jgi:hypothetical protein
MITKSGPKYFLIVLALAGDSIMSKFFGMSFIQ